MKNTPALSPPLCCSPPVVKKSTPPSRLTAPPPAGDGPSVATTTEPQTTATAEATAGAAVKLSPTQGNTANGALKITAAGTGVKISGMVQGLTPDSRVWISFS